MATKNIYQQYGHMITVDCKEVTKVVHLADSKHCSKIFYPKYCALNTVTNMQLLVRNFQQVQWFDASRKNPKH